MKKTELWFSGALFLALCAVASGGWFPAAPWCGGVFALLAGGLFWRGLVLSAAERADAAREREAAQSRSDEKEQQRKEQLDALLNAVQPLEALLREQEQHTTDALEKAAAQIVQAAEDQATALLEELRKQNSRLLKEIEALQEQTAQQHTAMQEWNTESAARAGEQLKKLDRVSDEVANAAKQSAEDNLAIYDVLDGIRETLELLEKTFPESFPGDLNLNAGNLERAVSKLPKKLEELGDSLEKQTGEAVKAIGRLSAALEKENREQREWTENLMQQYAAVTAQDLEIFSTIMGEG